MRWLAIQLFMIIFTYSKSCSESEDFGRCRMPQAQNFTFMGCIQRDMLYTEISTVCPFDEYSCVALLIDNSSYIGGCILKTGKSPVVFHKDEDQPKNLIVKEYEGFRLTRGCETFKEACENATVMLEDRTVRMEVCCCSGDHCHKKNPREWGQEEEEAPTTSWEMVTVSTASISTIIFAVIISFILKRYNVHRVRRLIKKGQFADHRH